MRLAIYSAFLLSVVASSASYAKKEIVWGGQIRPRYEFRDPFANNYDSFTSMRVRTQIVASLDSDVDLMIQLQDVRLWGEEKNTLTDYSADKFDLHQGYVHLKKLGDGDHSLKIGRQIVALGGQRLIGAVEWTQQGRVFDGLQLLLVPSWGQVNLTAIQVTESDSTSAQFADDAYLAGAYATLEQLPSGSLDLYALYNKDGAKDTDQVTMGARLVGKKTAYSYRFEGSFQTGQRSARDVSAFMFGGRVGGSLGGLDLTLWYDYLSGDDDLADDKTKVFDTLFATNHKYYGYADLFLNIPAHTGGLGLQDLALKAALPLSDQVSLGVHGHSFLTAQKGDLESSHLGEEVDLTLTYKYRPGFTIVAGLSRVIADDSMTRVTRYKDSIEDWNGDMTFTYLMTNTTF
ncbi:MAG: alginate export family protein [Gemmatimonadetes bacterium]|nr:alginate export family protein [Gemmatimonadota bacterium]